MLFGVSAFYHRPTWKPKARAFLKRFDHGSIFVFIAGTFTPLCTLALPEKDGNHLLMIIWIAAGIGLIQSIFWVHTPKWFSAALYVIMGWLVAPYMSGLSASLGMGNVMLIVAGGILYTVGAVFYAMKKPNFYPGIFGYHELFHLFVVIAAVLHFLVIYKLIN
jgi:hemolysin III